MQTIATTARRRVVYRQVQVVPSKKPLEGTAGFLMPDFFPGDPIRFEAGRDHRLCLHGLLIEAGAFAAALIKTIGANGDKMPPVCIGALQVCQPSERLKPHLGHPGIGYGLAAQ